MTYHLKRPESPNFCFHRTLLTVFQLFKLQISRQKTIGKQDLMFDDNHNDRAGKHVDKRKRDEEHHVGLPLRILMLLSEIFQRSDRVQQANSGTAHRRRKIERSRKSMRNRYHQNMQNTSPPINLLTNSFLSSNMYSN